MEKFGFFEKHRIPTYNNPNHIIFGLLAFNYNICTGCSMCVQCCPAKTLVMDNKIPRMKTAEENGECMACADCVAICPVQAISLKRPMILTRYFKTLDIGDLMPPRL